MPETARPCPVCASREDRRLLFLEKAPVYLHPVPPEAEVPEPHTLDLEYRQCVACGHGFQARFDMELLTSIYRGFYYTPAVESVAVTVREEFLDYLRSRPALSGFRPARVLEVGCSSGEALDQARRHYGLPPEAVLGLEPNRETAESARRYGLEVREDFFGAETAGGLGTFDLAFSRHVVEHIDALPPFLAALRQVVGEEGRVVLETPCLDYALKRGSEEAFHVEHLHVFSVASLALAASRAGLGMVDYLETRQGNLVATFRPSAGSVPVPISEGGADLQARHDLRCRWWAERLGRQPVVFWGAGSAARILLWETGCVPETICDGNPGKAGRAFVGLPHRIVHGPEHVARLVASGQDRERLLVASSMFHEEIRRDLDRLGWRGGFLPLDAYEKAHP